MLVNSRAFLAPQTRDSSRFSGAGLLIRVPGKLGIREPRAPRALAAAHPRPLGPRTAEARGLRAAQRRGVRPGAGARRPAGSLGMREVSDLERSRAPVEPRPPLRRSRRAPGRASVGLWARSLACSPRDPAPAAIPGRRGKSSSGALGALHVLRFAWSLLAAFSECMRRGRNIWSLASKAFGEGGTGVLMFEGNEMVLF